MDNPKDINDANERLIESIKKFASSYNALSPAGKTSFQNQINAQARKMDDRTKKLYEALVEATKEGRNVDKTIQAMEKADKQLKYGI